MIHFVCLQCGMKFKVKDEFAGRSTKCLTCKSPVQVPDPSKTIGYVPAENIDGSESSLDKAGVNPSVTLASHTGKDPASVEALAKKQVGRYVIDKEIARGGMGAVLRGIDRDIRREVAIKFMLNDNDTKQKARFVEEAQITGQLEHPNIVPVHELGVDTKKRLFFTMKMVRGRSLAQILETLAKEPKAEQEWSLSRLLNILVNICHALGYAHSLKVIHRDLKPANIMVGDFGEVYVMDWGLAKVLKESAPNRKASKQLSTSQVVSAGVSANSISTSREAEGDLTQDGVIMGTPAYMPPEQALGETQAIDHRSDIYSVGAILYAMLTLVPPVAKDGGKVALLLRVAEGDIQKPEVRTPKRHIPSELSAIAMKALAKEPKDRYQAVEAFRRDIELFLEGRSVSAKHDSVREQVWKLIKRNRAVSAVGSAAAMVLAIVLAWSSWSNYQAYKETEKANTELMAEKEQKTKRTRRAVPAFVQAAHTIAGEGRLDHALTQLDFALEYEPKQAEARLLRGQILIAQKDFALGRAELEKYLEQEPFDDDAETLATLCAPGLKDDLKFRLALAKVFQRQQAFTLAARILEDMREDMEARRALLVNYQAIIEKKWRGLGKSLVMDGAGQLKLKFARMSQVVSLEPLQGLQLDEINLWGCDEITDLAPLKGMSLTSLNLGQCTTITDLSPLEDMPLEILLLGSCGEIEDFTPLQTLKNLRNLYLNKTQIDDLSALRGLPLKELALTNCKLVKNLEPLQGLPLRKLYLSYTGIGDLTALAELKELSELHLRNCPVKDLTPLRGLPLKVLSISRLAGDRTPSLAPLKDMQLTELTWNPSTVAPQDIEIIRAMKSLKKIGYPPRRFYSSTEFWKQYDGGGFKNQK